MIQADGIVLESPVYSADVTAAMKAFLERAGVVVATNIELGHFAENDIEILQQFQYRKMAGRLFFYQAIGLKPGCMDRRN